YWCTCTRRNRCTPCTTRRSEPSGNLNILWMCVRVPTRYRSLSTGSSTAGSRCVTTPMTLRSLTASLTSATELSRATASGRMAWGNRMVSRRGSMASSPGTLARSTSVTPPESKSGLRSGSLILSLALLPASSAQGRRLVGPPRIAELGLLVLLALLARDAQRREGEGLQPGLRDVGAALGAGAVDPGLQPPDRLVDLAQGLRRHLHDREVHLLDEIVHALLLGVLHGRG